MGKRTEGIQNKEKGKRSEVGDKRGSRKKKEGRRSATIGNSRFREF